MPRRVEVLRIWGKADRFDLNFVRVGGDVWKADLPADLTDGQYACVLHAVDTHGGEAIWSGILYMHNGIATLQFDKVGLTLTFSAPRRYSLCFDPDGVRLTI